LREDRHRDDDMIDPAWFGEKSNIDIAKVHAVRGQVLPQPIEKVQWEALKDRLYELRGWDVETGRPAREKLELLGMKTVADDLERSGKLGTSEKAKGITA